MSINPRNKGYLFALGASFALANSFVFSKAALMEIQMVQFGVVWFGMGLVWNSIYIIYRKRKFSTIRGKGLWVNIVIAILEALATGLFYIAINKMENPAIVSFIGNIGPIFVTILGITLLKERFNRIEIAGILVALGGLFLINYNPSFTWKNMFLEGTVYVVLASFFFSIAAIIARKYNKYIEGSELSFVRVLLLFVSFVILFLFSSSDLEISSRALINMSIGSVLETLITIVLAYEAFKYIEATRNSLVLSTRSLFALLSAYLYFHIFPETFQVIGGLLTIIGVIAITSGQMLIKKKGSKNKA